MFYMQISKFVAEAGLSSGYLMGVVLIAVGVLLIAYPFAEKWDAKRYVRSHMRGTTDVLSRARKHLRGECR